jgi:hypothetical protein
MSSVHIFWITSRAAGVVALLASSLAVSLGLMMSLRSKLPDLRATHEALSLATIAAIVVHAVALLGDSFMKPSLADIAIRSRAASGRCGRRPGSSPAWMLILLGLSYYARAHRAGTLAQPASLHGAGLGARHPRRRRGTDASAVWFLAAAGMVVLPAGALPGRPPRPRDMIFRCFGTTCLVDAEPRAAARSGADDRLARALQPLPRRQRALAAERRSARGGPGQRHHGAARREP